MKQLKIMILIPILLVFSIILAGCQESISEENKKYSVTFVENDGTNVADIINLEKNSTISLPDITRKGYNFKGWFTSKKFISGTEVTTETKISKDIVVYANWEAIKYDVTINLDGGTFNSDGYDDQNMVTYGTIIDLPLPVKKEYLFAGWYINNDEVNGTIVVENDLQIDAKWIALNTLQPEYKLTLNVDDAILYQYATKEDLVNELMRDFSKYLGTDVDTTNFWDRSYDSFVGDNSFFSQKSTLDKWGFLFEYLSTTSKEEYREYFIQILDGTYPKGWDFNMNRTVIRNETLAFLLNTQRTVSNWDAIRSSDYSQSDLAIGYLDSIKVEAPTKYTTGEGIVLLEPVKEGYLFLGWYDNQEAQGNPYSEVSVNDYGDKEFFAIWAKLE